MLYYKYTLKPITPFSTYPASDTVFGQICRMLEYSGEDMDKLLADYESEPFAVVSDMLLQGAGSAVLESKKHFDGNRADKVKEMKDRKKRKAENMTLIESVLNGRLNEKIPLTTFKTMQVVRNSISRDSGGTEKDNFSPYSVFETFYYNDVRFHLYAYIKDEYIELVTKAITLMGEFGFGKDASIGKGRFLFEGIEECHVDNNKPYNAVYTLGNCVLEGLKCGNMYYDVCTRFGKHGGGERRPFKNPVVMAKQGALLFMRDIDKPYIGKAIKGLSYDEKTVHQGYSLYIPVEVKND